MRARKRKVNTGLRQNKSAFPPRNLVINIAEQNRAARRAEQRPSKSSVPAPTPPPAPMPVKMSARAVRAEQNKEEGKKTSVHDYSWVPGLDNETKRVVDLFDQKVMEELDALSEKDRSTKISAYVEEERIRQQQLKPNVDSSSKGKGKTHCGSCSIKACFLIFRVTYATNDHT